MSFFTRISYCIFCCFLVSASMLQGQAVRYVRAVISGNAADMAAVAEAGVSLDHVQTTSDGVVGEFSEWEIAQVERLGLQVTVLHPDASAWYMERYSQQAAGQESVANVPTAFNLGSMGGCLTFAEAMAELDSMALSFPNLVRPRDSIGRTHQGRAIWAVKISDNPNIDENEPEVLYIGLHHAREPISLMNLIYFMQYLLENYGSAPLVTHLIDNRELYFVPVLNPDGYVFNETTQPGGGGMWRKNRRLNPNNSYGVDLNRNYSYEFNHDNVGSSGDPNSETYRGPNAFSEPETQAIQKLCMAREFVTSISHHSWGEEMIHPWGFDPSSFLPAEERFRKYGEFLTSSSRYVPGNSSQTVGYLSNGNSDDYLYGNLSDKPEVLAFTAEIGNSTDWFWPAIPRIIPICQEMLQANLRIACLASSCVDVRPEIPCDLAGSQVWLPVRFANLGLESSVSFNSQFISTDPNIVSIDQGNINISGMSSGQEVIDSFRISLAPGIGKGTIISGIVRTLLPGSIIREDSVRFSYGIPEVIFVENGESGLGQWSGNWGITDEKSHAGVYSITDSPFIFYAPGTVNALVLQSPIDLTNYTRSRLEFYASWQVEADWDYVVVEASENGINFQALPGRFTKVGSGTHQPSGEPVFDGNRFFWTMEKMDLSAFDGKPLYLRITLSSNSIQERDGFYLDDLRVTGFKTLVGQDPDEPFHDLRLSPNPARGEVRLSGRNGIDENLSMELYNLQGKLVLSAAPDGNSRIDLSGLSAGAYFYRFCSGMDKSNMHKLILH